MTYFVVKRDGRYLSLEHGINFVISLTKATFFKSKFIAHGFLIEMDGSIDKIELSVEQMYEFHTYDHKARSVTYNQRWKDFSDMLIMSNIHELEQLLTMAEQSNLSEDEIELIISRIGKKKLARRKKILWYPILFSIPVILFITNKYLIVTMDFATIFSVVSILSLLLFIYYRNVVVKD